MKAHARLRVAAVLLAPALLAAACGESDAKKAQEQQSAAGKAAAACPEDINGTPSTPLPSNFPGLSGETVYTSDAQGATKVWFAYTSGGEGDINATRDKVNDALKAAGYEIEGTDQEAGIEAESEFKGPHTGTVQVEVLCKDKLRIRYKLDS